MLPALSVLLLGYNLLSPLRSVCSPRTVQPYASAPYSRMRELDALVANGDVPGALELLEETDLQPSPPQTAALLDTACAASDDAPPTAPAPEGAEENPQRLQQEKLKAIYDGLARAGSLRGFGSVSAVALLPASIDSKTMSTDDQLLLTGLPTSAFAPPSGGSRTDLALGAGSALLLSAITTQLGVDIRYSVAAVGGAMLADGIVFNGALAETTTRVLKPGYATRVREHEAGHFLVACMQARARTLVKRVRPRCFAHQSIVCALVWTDLLGCPIEACLLDVWRAARDGRFSGAAGTVFFDPELGDAMSGGRITREIIDRYSVIVMAGIAAEAVQNGRAEGGQADEGALVTLLTSLDGGKSWDLPRIRNQARWASSQALLLLREHGEAYRALCDALERGEGVGGCVMAIEAGITEAFGRNGELPAETRARELAARMRQAAAAAAVPAPEAAPSAGAATSGAEEVRERQAQIAQRLAEIRQRLEREEDTWTGSSS